MFTMDFSKTNKNKLYSLLKKLLIIKNGKIVNYEENFFKLVLFTTNLVGYHTESIIKSKDLVYSIVFINTLFEMMLSNKYFNDEDKEQIAAISEAVDTTYFEYSLVK